MRGIQIRYVDLRQRYKEKYEEGVASGGICEPPGEGDFFEEMLIAGWTDGGNKAAKSFPCETSGLIDDGRQIVVPESESPRARRDVLERVPVAIFVMKESRESAIATQTPIGEEYEKLSTPIPVQAANRFGLVKKHGLFYSKE